MMSTYFTIGHSTRPIAEFIELLQEANVQLVADVRAIPRSRTNPQYNRDSLPVTLAKFEIAYRHLSALGGRRRKARGIAPEINGFWRHASFHNFADYAMSSAFHAGLAELREAGDERRCAIMCAETLWWRCHRRIIADYLMAAGETVFHILGGGHIERATLTPAARLRPDCTLVFPASPRDPSSGSGDKPLGDAGTGAGGAP
ncbi:MAG TPA: DUF488 domain-containing protein [Hyphomicrobiaceae bacterium]